MIAIGSPAVVSIVVTVRCKCGEEHEFNEIEDGATYSQPCDCGRTLLIDGEIFTQYEGEKLVIE